MKAIKAIGKWVMFLLVAMAAIGSVAFAAATVVTSPPAVDWGKLFSDPVLVGAVIAPVLSSVVTMPLTQFVKNWFKLDGRQAEILNGAMNAAVLAALPFIGGVYQFKLEGIAYAALLAGLGYAVDKGFWKLGKSLSGADSPPIGAGQ